MQKSKRGTGKSLTFITCIIIAIIAVVGIAALLRSKENRNSSLNIDTNVRKQKSETSRQIEEHQQSKFVGYDIRLASRPEPCSGARYTVLREVAHPLPIAADVTTFVETSKSLPIEVYATEAQRIVDGIDIEGITHKYRFGELKEESWRKQVNEQFERASRQFETLKPKLAKWNDEVDEKRRKYNDTIVAGPKERCFDNWIITALDFEDYADKDLMIRHALNF